MEDFSEPGANSKETNQERMIRLEQLKELYFKLYPTNEHCWSELFRMSNPDKKECPECGSEKVKLEDDGREIRCLDCDATQRLTAGTFFHRVREIRAWFGAIWLMENGAIFSAYWFHKAFGIAYSTAWMIQKKLSKVLLQSAPDNASELHSSLFASIFGRRSRETPAREHPSSEQRQAEQDQAERDQAKHRQAQKNAESGFAEGSGEGHETQAPNNNQSETGSGKSQSFGQERQQQKVQSNGADKADQNERGARARADIAAFFDALEKGHFNQNSKEETLEDKVFNLLSKEPTHVEALAYSANASPGDLSAVLMLLEIQGLIKRLPGEFYVRAPDAGEQFARGARNSNNSFKPDNARTLNDFKQCVRLVFHRISRKYLQLFIYKYWCQLDRRRWGKGSLFEACLQSDFIEDSEVLTYVSPINVWFPQVKSKQLCQSN